MSDILCYASFVNMPLDVIQTLWLLFTSCTLISDMLLYSHKGAVSVIIGGFVAGGIHKSNFQSA